MVVIILLLWLGSSSWWRSLKGAGLGFGMGCTFGFLCNFHAGCSISLGEELVVLELLWPGSWMFTRGSFELHVICLGITVDWWRTFSCHVKPRIDFIEFHYRQLLLALTCILTSALKMGYMLVRKRVSGCNCGDSQFWGHCITSTLQMYYFLVLSHFYWRLWT